MTSAHNSNDVRIFHKECVSLAAAGHEVYLVAPGDSREEKGVHVVGVGAKPVSRLQRMTGMARKVYQAAMKLDCEVYHLHEPELLPYGLRMKKHGKKVIFDSHENYPEQILHKGYLPKPARKLVSGVFKAFETFSVKKFDAVIFPCTINGKNIFENRAKKTVFIDNYPLLSELPQESVSHDAENRRNVCYAGALSFTRGITTLLKAAYKENTTLLLAGSFSPASYQQELEAMPEYQCVKYLGRLDRNEVFAMYRHSSIGMATLLNIGQYHIADNLPTKVLEYMGAGLPVIVSDYPYGRKVIEQYQCGICVHPDNVEEIVGAIRFLLEHPEKAREMGMNGRRAVEEDFHWGNEEKKLLSLYNSLVPGI